MHEFISQLRPDYPEIIWQIGAYNPSKKLIEIIDSHPNWFFDLFDPSPFVNEIKKPNVKFHTLAVTKDKNELVDFFIPIDVEKYKFAKKTSGLSDVVINKFDLGSKKIKVDAVSIQSIPLITHNAPTAIMTDVESHDGELIDLALLYKPRLYQFEHAHLDDCSKKSIHSKLEIWGFVFFVATKFDEIWIKKKAQIKI